MWLQVVLLIVGFVLLYYGAEWLVKGSANLARSLGITPIVIGLTVVAFGTSSPELVVSVISSMDGKSMRWFLCIRTAPSAEKAGRCSCVACLIHGLSGMYGMKMKNEVA